MNAAGAPVRQAVVLAGGLGSRLGRLTKATPKPLLPVGGRPFLSYLLAWLARSGIEEVLVSTGYLPEAFAAFLEGSEWRSPYGHTIVVNEVREPVPADTGGALALAADRLDERFLVINGDTFFDCDLPAIVAAADRLPRGGQLLTVREVDDAGRFGRVKADAEGRVTVFGEKSGTGPGLINAGISVLDRSVLELMPAVPASLEHDVYPRLAAAGRLFREEAAGYFIDIGVPETYERAQRELPAQASKAAAFFDRDGVLNVDEGHTHRVEDLRFVEGAAAAVRAARGAGYLTVVVTNQAGVAKGYYDEAAVERFHRRMNRELRAEGAWIDAFYYCPHHPEATVSRYRGHHPERKPEPGMIERAIRELGIDRKRSFLVGDKDSDLEAARCAGIPGHRYEGGRLDALVASILEAA